MSLARIARPPLAILLAVDFLLTSETNLMAWFYWWSRGGANPWPSPCERDALPAELRPRGVRRPFRGAADYGDRAEACQARLRRGGVRILRTPAADGTVCAPFAPGFLSDVRLPAARQYGDLDLHLA